MSLGAVDKGELSLKALSGKGTPHNKGLLDLALLKFHLNRLCLSTIMDALWADAKAKEMLRSTTGGFRMYRDHFGRPSDDEVQPSNTWMALIPASLQKSSWSTAPLSTAP